MKIFFSVAFLLISFTFFGQESITFYFDTNKFVLNKSELAKLDTWVSLNKKSKILSITGATDHDGSSAYNDTLSQRRVDFIFSKVKNTIAIREDFKSISLGEEGALVDNKAISRKATIVFLQEKDLAKEADIIKQRNKKNVKPAQSSNLSFEGIVPIEESAMNFPENATLEEKIKLSRPGTLIVLKEVLFYKNTFGIVPTSKKEILDLSRIMILNPTLYIEVQGHICCVDKDLKNLSLDRAKQVRRNLVTNKVSESHVKVKGFGVSKPKFKIPETTDDQAAANRRVEIMILAK